MAKPGEGSGTSSPARRQNEGSVAPSLANFSSLREMLRKERESAQADRQAWAAELRGIWDELELRVQLALSERQSKSAAQGSPAVGGRSTTKFAGANLGALSMEDPARRLAGIEAPGSRGESGRPFGGAVQGSAAAVSGRVSFLSGTLSERAVTRAPV